MKTEYKDAKGVIVLMRGDTQNTFPYKDNKDLFRMLEKFGDDIDIYDFTDKFVYYIFNKKDIEELKKELGE